MADTVFNSFKQDSLQGSFNLNNDTIKVALVTGLPDIDNNTYLSEVTEITAPGYTLGGKVLTNKAFSGNEGIFSLLADNVSWQNSTISCRYAVIYKSTGVAASSPLIGYIDFGSTKTSQEGEFLIQWNPAGIIQIKSA